MCHFVLDNIGHLDATVTDASNGARLRHQPAPWLIRPTLKADLLRAWERYPVDPHDA
jgi:hypothetical protein